LDPGFGSILEARPHTSAGPGVRESVSGLFYRFYWLYISLKYTPRELHEKNRKTKRGRARKVTETPHSSRDPALSAGSSVGHLQVGPGFWLNFRARPHTSAGPGARESVPGLFYRFYWLYISLKYTPRELHEKNRKTKRGGARNVAETPHSSRDPALSAGSSVGHLQVGPGFWLNSRARPHTSAGPGVRESVPGLFYRF
jgi:hypothetical protein